MAGKSWTAALRVRRLLEASNRKGRRRLTCYRRRCRKIIKGGDVISSLPDVILQHILTYIPTKFAIRTSLLSKRWRHVWCDIPSLSFGDYNTPDGASINKTLSYLYFGDYNTLDDASINKTLSYRYFGDYNTPDDASINKTLSYHTAPKMMNFHLRATSKLHVDKWTEFAISRNVENLSLEFNQRECPIPDFFFINSSVKQLTLKLIVTDLTPKYPVSWTSLKKLSLRCKLSDESIAKILSGCPVLECLKLYFDNKLMNLDLTKSLRLTTLEIGCYFFAHGPRQILAPHIHSLTLTTSQLLCTLVDVSSLTEAKMEIRFSIVQNRMNAEFLKVMVLKMLEKLQNAEKLTFEPSFLQVSFKHS